MHICISISQSINSLCHKLLGIAWRNVCESARVWKRRKSRQIERLFMWKLKKKNDFNIVSRKIDNSYDGASAKFNDFNGGGGDGGNTFFSTSIVGEKWLFFFFSFFNCRHNRTIEWSYDVTKIHANLLYHIYTYPIQSFTRSHRIFSVAYVTVLMRPSPLTTLKRNSTKVY